MTAQDFLCKADWMALRMVINILLGGLGIFILTLIILFVFSLILHI